MVILTENSNIRRIDELGRIVIPKDIRKRLHIKDGETLEIFVENEEIRIKKYELLKDVKEHIDYLLDVWNRLTTNKYIITDREKVYCANDKKILDNKLNSELQQLVLNCTEERNQMRIMKFDQETIQANTNIIPLIVDNNRVGLIIEYNETRDISNNTEIKLLKTLIENRMD